MDGARFYAIKVIPGENGDFDLGVLLAFFSHYLDAVIDKMVSRVGSAIVGKEKLDCGSSGVTGDFLYFAVLGRNLKPILVLCKACPRKEKYPTQQQIAIVSHCGFHREFDVIDAKFRFALLNALVRLLQDSHVFFVSANLGEELSQLLTALDWHLRRLHPVLAA